MTIKIIDGLRYNTETATAVAEWDNGLHSGDFKNCDETLFRTKRGNWFTCGSGGPMSRYARATGQNEWSGSSDVIRAIDADDARAWLEGHGFTKAIETYFGDQIEDA